MTEVRSKFKKHFGPYMSEVKAIFPFSVQIHYDLLGVRLCQNPLMSKGSMCGLATSKNKFVNCGSNFQPFLIITQRLIMDREPQAKEQLITWCKQVIDFRTRYVYRSLLGLNKCVEDD